MPSKTLNKRRTSLSAAMALSGTLGLLNTGCANQAPCVAYVPQLQTKTVSLRGYGAVEVTSEELVCAQRENLEVAVR